jgi:hypothetical protein
MGNNMVGGYRNFTIFANIGGLFMKAVILLRGKIVFEELFL